MFEAPTKKKAGLFPDTKPGGFFGDLQYPGFWSLFLVPLGSVAPILGPPPGTKKKPATGKKGGRFLATVLSATCRNYYTLIACGPKNAAVFWPPFWAPLLIPGFTKRWSRGPPKRWRAALGGGCDGTISRSPKKNRWFWEKKMATYFFSDFNVFYLYQLFKCFSRGGLLVFFWNVFLRGGCAGVGEGVDETQ